VKAMEKKLECPFGIPEDQCCQEKDCPVYQARLARKIQE